METEDGRKNCPVGAGVNAENLLREYESKLGMIGRYGDTRVRAHRAIELTEEVLIVNERRLGSDEIRRAVAELREILLTLT